MNTIISRRIDSRPLWPALTRAMFCLAIMLVAVLIGTRAVAQEAAPPPGGAPPHARRIALSFDDVPRSLGPWLSAEERSARLIAALAEARVTQAAFFVNPANLSADYGAGGEARIAAYVQAGHVIANHSNTHPHLNATPASDFLADLDAATAWLSVRPGYRPWFRFPYLDEGGADREKRAAVRAGLAARGLINGYATADGSDWNMEALTIAAVRDGRAVNRDALRDLYVETMVEAANTYDAIAVRALGRSPAHVMLLHETDLAAYYIADLVAALRADGWTIITADEAYADPLTQARPEVPVLQGTITEMMAWAAGLPAPRWYGRNDTRIANALYAERVLGEAAANPGPRPVAVAPAAPVRAGGFPAVSNPLATAHE